MESFLERRRAENKAKKTIEHLESLKLQNDSPQAIIDNPQSFSVYIKINNKLKHGSFLPDTERPGTWFTTAQTFRAMKKDIFSLGEDIDTLKEPYKCKSCSEDLDKQFWFFCPYCGDEFKK